jgi:hypothetical protein
MLAFQVRYRAETCRSLRGRSHTLALPRTGKIGQKKTFTANQKRRPDAAARNGRELKDIVSQYLPDLRQLIALGLLHPAPRTTGRQVSRDRNRARKGVRKVAI